MKAIRNVPQRAKTIGMVADYADMICEGFYHGFLYGEDRIKHAVATMASAGVTDIFWRTSCIGMATYRSDVRNRMDGVNMTEETKDPAPCVLVLQQCDPLLAAEQACHSHGMRLVLPSPNAPKGVAARGIPEGSLPLVAVEGTAYECGRSYGEIVRKRWPNFRRYMDTHNAWLNLSEEVKKLFDRRAPHMLEVFRGLGDADGQSRGSRPVDERGGCTSFPTSSPISSLEVSL